MYVYIEMYIYRSEIIWFGVLFCSISYFRHFIRYWKVQNSYFQWFCNISQDGCILMYLVIALWLTFRLFLMNNTLKTLELACFPRKGTARGLGGPQALGRDANTCCLAQGRVWKFREGVQGRGPCTSLGWIQRSLHSGWPPWRWVGPSGMSLGSTRWASVPKAGHLWFAESGRRGSWWHTSPVKAVFLVVEGCHSVETFQKYTSQGRVLPPPARSRDQNSGGGRACRNLLSLTQQAPSKAVSPPCCQTCERGMRRPPCGYGY